MKLDPKLLKFSRATIQLRKREKKFKEEKNIKDGINKTINQILQAQAEHLQAELERAKKLTSEKEAEIAENKKEMEAFEKGGEVDNHGIGKDKYETVSDENTARNALKVKNETAETERKELIEAEKKVLAKFEEKQKQIKEKQNSDEEARLKDIDDEIAMNNKELKSEDNKKKREELEAANAELNTEKDKDKFKAEHDTSLCCDEKANVTSPKVCCPCVTVLLCYGLIIFYAVYSTRDLEQNYDK